MIKKLIEKIGEILCLHGWHKERLTDGCNVAGGTHCIRKGCSYKTDPIEWPRLPEKPLK